jgi:DNA segregation ATPase FtsK/SpoIIIE-like protein
MKNIKEKVLQWAEARNLLHNENALKQYSKLQEESNELLIGILNKDPYEIIDALGELDPMFADAARIVVLHQQGSASLLQRKLKLGYNRAGRIVDQLEAFGIIGPFQGSKAREVLYAEIPTLDQFLATKNIF